MKIAKVIVDIASSLVDKVFDYSFDEQKICLDAGFRVLVPFGKIKKEGYVVSIEETSELDRHKLKEIICTLDGFAVIHKDQFELANFLKQNFNIGLADSFRLFLPSEMRNGNVKELVKLEYYITDDAAAKAYLLSVRKNSSSIIGIINHLLSCGSEFSANLSKKFGASAIKRLVNDNILASRAVTVRRKPYKSAEGEQTEDVNLTEVQSRHVERIVNEKNIYLLHGVTGSGKTEVYIHAMQRVLEQGKTGIMLVPEISLTPQVLSIFRSKFGDNVAILHSGLSAGERFDEWRRILFQDAKIVIGARSAIFAPLENIGLIVIDEEHDGSYTSDSNPRYNTIDVATKRAEIFGASLVLGSATPSLVSYHGAMTGKYQLLEMKQRINKKALPPLKIIDMGNEVLCGNSGVFSNALLSALKKTISEHNQAMLFINRRGFASFVMCKSCGWVAKCKDCDVSLVLHRAENALKCHYCGNRYKIITKCPDCGNTELSSGAVGTERVVKELETLLPNVRTLRMDNDTTKTKDAHLKILSDFRQKKADVLVGTQMIAKGHDFPSVTLVGIIDADISLYQTSYTASELTFQLITQVAGRAGRADKSGEIYLQTYVPRHYVYRLAASYDYTAFYQKEINLRSVTMYPPFSRIIRILFVSQSENLAKSVAKVYYDNIKALQSAMPNSFIYLGAMKSPIGRIQNKYRLQILMRIKAEDAQTITSKIFEIDKNNKKSLVQSFVEINPQNLN